MPRATYVLQFKKNQLRYIGWCSNPEKFKEGIVGNLERKEYGGTLQKAFDEFGEFGFTFRVLETVKGWVTNAEMNERKKVWIKKLHPELNCRFEEVKNAEEVELGGRELKEDRAEYKTNVIPFRRPQK